MDRSLFRQLAALIRRNALIFIGEPKKVTISIVAPILITILVVTFCDNKAVGDLYEDTRFVLFIIVTAAAYMGMFNSLALVCKERDIIRKEYMTGMSLSCYVISNIIFQAGLVLVQALIFSVGYWLSLDLDFSDTSVLLGSPFICFFINIFLVMIGADAIGLLISCLAPTVEIANLTAPVVVVLQTVLSGVLFSLNGWKMIASNLSLSKWGLDGIGSILNLLTLPRRTSTYLGGLIVKYFPELNGYNDIEEVVYNHSPNHILICWSGLIIITVAACLLCIIVLKVKRK